MKKARARWIERDVDSKGSTDAIIVPLEAKAVINFRILQGDSVDAVTNHVRKVVDHPHIAVRLFGGASFEPSPVSDLGSAGFAAFHKTVRQVFPRAVVAPILVIAGTETKYYVTIADNNYRFLPLRIARTDLSHFHGIDERIAIDNYAEIIRFYVYLLQNSAAASGE